MELKDVAYLLAYIGTKMTYRAGMGKVAIDDATVRSWKSDLDHGNCNHAHIAIRAIDDHFRSPAGQYGITPAELVNAYNRIAARMVERLDVLVPQTPPDDVTAYLAERRNRVAKFLGDPQNLAALDAAPPKLKALAAAPIPDDVAAAIAAATPTPAKRKPVLVDPDRLASARAELDANRTKGEPA